jgi:hypothetical protein
VANVFLNRWKLREAALFILNVLLRDFNEVEQQVPLELATGFTECIRYCLQHEQDFLRARAYLVAGVLAQTAGEGFQQTAASYLEATLKAIRGDSSEVVQVACIRVLQDLLPALPSSITQPMQNTDYQCHF